MKSNLKVPCNDCPWRRVSAPGWLGSGSPEYFVSAALADSFGGAHQESSYAEPCHKTIDYDDAFWASKADEHEVCVGALVFYRNVDRFKMPRDARRAKLVASVEPDHGNVFSTPQEFVDHHTRGARSWE